jgi:hypothetical protein
MRYRGVLSLRNEGSSRAARTLVLARIVEE